MTWDCHKDDFARVRSYIISGRDILTQLGLNIKSSNYFFEVDYGTLKGFMEPMVDMGTYKFTYLETGKSHLKNHL